MGRSGRDRGRVRGKSSLRRRTSRRGAVVNPSVRPFQLFRCFVLSFRSQSNMRTVWVYISKSRVRGARTFPGRLYFSLCILSSGGIRRSCLDSRGWETRHDHTGISPAFQIQSTQFFVSIMRLVFVCGCVCLCVCDFFLECERQRESITTREASRCKVEEPLNPNRAISMERHNVG